MMVWWLWGLACKSDDPLPVEPEGRVLDGPLVGSALQIDQTGALWVSAPGVAGDGGLYRFDGPSGSISSAGASILAGSEEVGPAFAICDLNLDGSDDVVLGAPELDGRGGAWWLRAPLPGEVSGAAFVAGIEDGGRAGAAITCGEIDGQTVAAVSSPEADGLGVAVSGGSVGLYVDGDRIDKIASLETSWSDSRLGYPSGLLLGEDLDGDGVGDLAVGAAGADRVHLLYGPLGGSYQTAASPMLIGDDREATGTALASGDIDGDGDQDLLVGAPQSAGATGAFWVVDGPLGADAPLLRNVARKRPGVQGGDEAGSAIAAVPDVDGDGTDEILIGAPGAGGVGDAAGAAYLVLGPALDTDDLDTADAIFLGEVALGRLGASLAAGDIGGDGIIDLVIGAPESDTDGTIGAGAVHVFAASLRGVHYPEDAEGHIGL